MQAEEAVLPLAEDENGAEAQIAAAAGHGGLELELLLVPVGQELAEGGIVGQGRLETLRDRLVEGAVLGHLRCSFLPLLGQDLTLLGQGLEEGDFFGRIGADIGIAINL